MISINVLRSQFSDPLGPYEIEPKDLASYLAEAEELAKAAYLSGDRKAFEESERLLYFINYQSGFGPPVQILPSLIWSTLIRGKLKSALQNARKEIPSEMSFKEMKNSLENLVQVVQERDHSLIDEIGNSKNWKALALYSKNRTISAFGFDEQLALLFRNCHDETRQVIQENISDEYDKTPHTELRHRYNVKTGTVFVPEKVFEDEDYLIEGISLLNFRTGICSLNYPYYALGSFYSIEAVFSQISEKLNNILPMFKLDDEAMEFFQLHATVDKGHAEEWLEGIETPKITPPDRSAVVVGAAAQLHIRHQHFEAIRNRLKSEPEQLYPTLSVPKDKLFHLRPR
jgi:pyrroloquinoline quinone (PQQ) biosynthesis protein C